ncbi:hypothetical protein, partial [Roseobacter sp.]|uniref:hypothetical protein n=1 Tax=Roseobacter sp. TaxID=1907202 RepID=UPI0032972531
EHQSDYQKRLSRMTEMADIIIQPPIDGTPFPHRSHETLLCGRVSIVIQLHSKGRVSVSSRNGTFSVNTPSKPEISPSRLGNVFVAGFLAALSQNDGLIPRALAMTHSETLSTAAEFGIKAAQTFPDMGSQLHDIKQDLS